MTDLPNGIGHDDKAAPSFIPEDTVEAANSILWGIITVDSRQSVDPDIAAFLAYVSAGMAAKSILDDKSIEFYSEEIKNQIASAIEDLAALLMALVIRYSDPSISDTSFSYMVTDALERLANYKNFNEVIILDTGAQISRIVNDCQILIREDGEVNSAAAFDIFKHSISMVSKSMLSDPLLESSDEVTMLLLALNGIVQDIESEYLKGLFPSTAYAVGKDMETYFMPNNVEGFKYEFTPQWRLDG